MSNNKSIIEHEDETEEAKLGAELTEVLAKASSNQVAMCACFVAINNIARAEGMSYAQVISISQAIFGSAARQWDAQTRPESERPKSS